MTALPILGDEDVDLALLGEATSPTAAAKLLKRFGSLLEMERAGHEEITRITGQSYGRARVLLAAMQLGRRAAMGHWPKGTPFRSADDVARAFGPLLSALEHEQFWVVSLDAKYHRMAQSLAARGAVTECVVSSREVFVEPLRMGAAAVILLHNHPSGDPAPSAEDNALTKRLVAAGTLLDIPVIDHVILARGGFYSYAEHRAL